MTCLLYRDVGIIVVVSSAVKKALEAYHYSCP